MSNVLLPAEIAEVTVESSVKKVNMKWWKQFVLGIMAGLFIALAGNASSIVAYGASSVGMGKMLSGALFGTGLIMVLLSGAELFTGNCMIFMAVMEGKTRTSAMLKNWFIVYLGNMVGGIGYTFLMGQTTQMSMDGGELGAYAINVAFAKSNLDFKTAFIMGIFCNILVCIAIWVSYASKDVAGKIIALFFPIWIFVVSGYEHCVANMYFIPMGIFASNNDKYVEAANRIYGLTSSDIATINWKNFFTVNLVPVTLGNIFGGVVCFSLIYWGVYLRKKEKTEKTTN